jgi:hypothetical protein
MNEQPSDWIKLLVKYKGKCKNAEKKSLLENTHYGKKPQKLLNIWDVIYNTSQSHLLLSCHVIYAEDLLDVSIAYMNQTVIGQWFLKRVYVLTALKVLMHTKAINNSSLQIYNK